MTDKREKRPYTMSEAAIAQRHANLPAAAAAATGPNTPEGKAASSRNAWVHGRYSAINRAQFASGATSIAKMFGKPCVTTCPFHPDNPDRTEAPCSLVLEPNNEDHALRVGIAAALAAQPRASEPAGRQGEAVASLRIFGAAGRTGVPSYALGRLPAMDRLPVGDYALYLHHAAPVGVGVPDGWKVQIDVGPEKAVHVTNPSGAWVGILGYVSQREQFLADFFRAQLAAAPSQGESNNG